MSALEAVGQLNRKVETLPNDAEFAERYAAAKPLTRPEIGVLLSYAKLTLFDTLVASSLPDEPYLQHLLTDYFPSKMQKAYAADITGHRLHREIVATSLANQVVNRGGPGFVQKLVDASGMLAPAVVKAAMIVEDGFGLKRLWSEIDQLDGQISGDVQNGLYAMVARIYTDATRLYLQTANTVSGSMTDEIGKLKTAIKSLSPGAAKYKEEVGFTQIDGVAPELVRELETLSLLVYVPEIMLIAEQANTTLARAADSYGAVSVTFRVARLLDAGQRVTPADHYESLALLRSQDQISASRRRIVISALTEHAKEKNPVQAWYAADRVRVNRIVSELAALSDSGDTNLARLTVAAGLLSDIVQARNV
jgi:glutamate dehydrogenase